MRSDLAFGRRRLDLRIAIVIVHFGDRPGWLDIWEASASWNSCVDFLVFNDFGFESRYPNIKPISLDLVSFNNRESLRSRDLRISRGYKLCDFRPLFGEIFRYELSGYDYWGWGDTDVLYGQIMESVSCSLGVRDYIGTGRDGQSGPLALLRNDSRINGLWVKISDWRNRLNSNTAFALDEIDFVKILRAEADCDLEFRECLDDLPALWSRGRICALESECTYALHHFGGRLSYTRAQIVRDQMGLRAAVLSGHPVLIGHDGVLACDSFLARSRERLVRILRFWKREFVRRFAI